MNGPRTRRRLWTIIGILAGVLLLGAIAVQAMGGRTGLLLAYLRVFMREDNAAFREIAWQQGPTAPIAPPAGTASGARPPNVILIVVDDLGFNDLTLRGGGVAGGRVPTRNIDALAQQGVSFDVAYSGNATCAPSRAAILTGRYATRFGFEFTPTPKQFMQVVTRMERPGQTLHRAVYFGDGGPDQPAYEDMGLPKSEITLARLLCRSANGTSATARASAPMRTASTSRCRCSMVAPCFCRRTTLEWSTPAPTPTRSTDFFGQWSPGACASTTARCSGRTAISPTTSPIMRCA
jgi:hypothetical protein